MLCCHLPLDHPLYRNRENQTKLLFLFTCEINYRLILFYFELVETKEITLKLLKMIKHTSVKGTSHSKAIKFCTTMQYQSFRCHRKWRRLTPGCLSHQRHKNILKQTLLQVSFKSICTVNYSRLNQTLSFTEPFATYSVTNSTGVTQRFSTNHKTSSEQKNQSSFISDQSQMRDLRGKVRFHQRKGN